MTGAGVAAARRALARGSKSFALAGKLLPRGMRADAAVVYAFCRRADDLIDDAGADAAAGVAQLRAEVDTIYAGRPQPHPVLAAFQAVATRCRLPRGPVDDLLRGFAMDARPAPIAYQSWDELLLYCYRVAGTVGLMMCAVMGVTEPRALRHAAALGMAMQLTNIARDVAEDWARGRLYLPRAILPSRLIPGDALAAAAPALRKALPPLLAAAEPLYRAGDAGLRWLPGRAALAIRAARLIYSAIGAEIAARDHDVTGPRVVVPRARKLWLLARASAETAWARLVPGTGRDHLPPLPGPLPRPFLELPGGAHG